MKTIPQEAFELGIKHTSVYATFYRERKEVVPVMAQGEMVLVYDAGTPLFVAVPLATMLSILKGSPTPPVTQTPPKSAPAAQTSSKQEQSGNKMLSREEVNRMIKEANERESEPDESEPVEKKTSDRRSSGPTFETYRAISLEALGPDFDEEQCKKHYAKMWGNGNATRS